MQNRKFNKLIKKVNVYPPYLGMGIRVRSLHPLRGGTQGALVQPEPVRLALRRLPVLHVRPFFRVRPDHEPGTGLHRLGQIGGDRILQAGKRDDSGVFEIGPEQIGDIRLDVDEKGRNTYHFEADLTNAEGVTVTRVCKEIYVRVKED